MVGATTKKSEKLSSRHGLSGFIIITAVAIDTAIVAHQHALLIRK
jgi:hypothetical protein